MALARPEIHDKSNVVCPRETLSETSEVWAGGLIAQVEVFASRWRACYNTHVKPGKRFCRRT